MTATDLKHLNEANVETIVSLVRGLLANGGIIPNCILYGFETTPGIPTGTYYAPGAAILNGEICVFDGQTVSGAIPAPPNVYAIQTNDTYLSGNPVLYADATFKNVHLVRKAVISIVTTPLSSTQLLLSNAPKFMDLLKANVLSEDSGWLYVGAPGAAPFYNSFDSSFPWSSVEVTLRYRRFFGRTAILEGLFNFEGVGTLPLITSINTTPLIVTQLPIGFRPDNGESYCTIRVETPDGECYFDARVTGGGRLELYRVYGYPNTVTASSFAGTLSTGRAFFHYALN